MADPFSSDENESSELPDEEIGEPIGREGRERRLRNRAAAKSDELTADDIEIERTIKGARPRVSEQARLDALRKNLAEQAGPEFTPDDVVVESGSDGPSARISETAQRRVITENVLEQAGDKFSPEDVEIQDTQDGLTGRISEDAIRETLREDFLEDAGDEFAPDDVVIEQTDEGFQARISEAAQRRRLREKAADEAGRDFSPSDIEIKDVEDGLSAEVSLEAQKREVREDLARDAGPEFDEDDILISVSGSGKITGRINEAEIERVKQQRREELKQDVLDNTVAASVPTPFGGDVEITGSMTEQEAADFQERLEEYTDVIGSGSVPAVRSFTESDVVIEETDDGVTAQISETAQEREITESVLHRSEALEDASHVDVAISESGADVSLTERGQESVSEFQRQQAAEQFTEFDAGELEQVETEQGVTYQPTDAALRERAADQTIDVNERAARQLKEGNDVTIEQFRSFQPEDFEVVETNGDRRVRVEEEAQIERAAATSVFDEDDFEFVETDSGRELTVTDAGLVDAAADQSELLSENDFEVIGAEGERQVSLTRSGRRDVLEAQVEQQLPNAEVVDFTETESGELDPIVRVEDEGAGGQTMAVSELEDVGEIDASEVVDQELSLEPENEVGTATKTTVSQFDADDLTPGPVDFLKQNTEINEGVVDDLSSGGWGQFTEEQEDWIQGGADFYSGFAEGVGKGVATPVNLGESAVQKFVLDEDPQKAGPAQNFVESGAQTAFEIGNIPAWTLAAESALEVGGSAPGAVKEHGAGTVLSTGIATTVAVGEAGHEYAAENPVRAAGGVAGGYVGGAVASRGVGKTGRVVSDRVRTAGGSRVDLEDVTGAEAARYQRTGGDEGERFPGADDADTYIENPPEAVAAQARDRTPDDIDEAFNDVGVEEGVVLKKALAVEPEGPGAGRSAQGFRSAPGESLDDFDYETPGSFVGPDLSPNFLRTGERSFSLRPGLPELSSKPTGVLIKTQVRGSDSDTLEEFNKELIERSGETAARTKPSDAVNPSEIEAVIPPGSTFSDIGGGLGRNLLRRAGIGSDFYTEVGGRRVPLRPVKPDSDSDLSDGAETDAEVITEAFQGKTVDDLTSPVKDPTDRPVPAVPPSTSGTSRSSSTDMTDGAAADVDAFSGDTSRSAESDDLFESRPGASSPGSTDVSGVAASDLDATASSSEANAVDSDATNPLSEFDSAVSSPVDPGVSEPTSPPSSVDSGGPPSTPVDVPPSTPPSGPPTEPPSSPPSSPPSTPPSGPPSSPPSGPPSDGPSSGPPSPPGEGPPSQPPRTPIEIDLDSEPDKKRRRFDFDDFEKEFESPVASPDEILDGVEAETDSAGGSLFDGVDVGKVNEVEFTDL